MGSGIVWKKHGGEERSKTVWKVKEDRKGRKGQTEVN